MSSLGRVLLLAVLCVLLGVSVQGQCTGVTDSCTELQMGVTLSADIYISLALTYETASNTICSLKSTSTINGPSSQSATVVLVSGSVTPNAAGTALTSINLQFTANGIAGSVVGSLVNGGGTLTYSGFNDGSSNPQPIGPAFTTTPAAFDSCTGAQGDPLFKGFNGQQFYISGEDGQVINILSTFNMQLNGRLVQLNEGQAIMPDEQNKLRLMSEARHQTEPAVAAFPVTVPWSHPGTYFGEAGVALLDDNRLYVKAGSYAQGWAKVTLNGRPLQVSDSFVVLGQDVNTTYIQRVSAHEVLIRTINVEFKLTNSDHFLNVDEVHLEKGFRQYNHFAGILGQTVDAKWSWNQQAEQESVVKSNDLFERVALEL